MDKLDTVDLEERETHRSGVLTIIHEWVFCDSMKKQGVCAIIVVDKKVGNSSQTLKGLTLIT